MCHIVVTFNGTSRIICNCSLLKKFWDKDGVGAIRFLSLKNFTICILHEKQCLLQTWFSAINKGRVISLDLTYLFF